MVCFLLYFSICSCNFYQMTFDISLKVYSIQNCTKFLFLELKQLFLYRVTEPIQIVQNRLNFSHRMSYLIPVG